MSSQNPIPFEIYTEYTLAADLEKQALRESIKILKARVKEVLDTKKPDESDSNISKLLDETIAIVTQAIAKCTNE